MQLIKRLLGEGLEIRIWDREVSLGNLIGSNRQYIQEVIPTSDRSCARRWKKSFKRPTWC